MGKYIERLDMRRLTDVINSFTEEERQHILRAFREEFPEYYWFTEASGRVSVEVPRK